MTDIQSTLAVSIKDEIAGFNAKIDANNDFYTKSKLWDGVTQANVSTDNRLKTEDKIISYKEFNPKTDYGFTDISFNNKVLIATETTEGKIDEIVLYTDTNKLKVTFTIDNVEVYSIAINDLKDRLKLSSTDASFNIYDKGKGFIDKYGNGIYFNSNFKIEVETIDGSTGNVKGFLIKWRQKI